MPRRSALALALGAATLLGGCASGSVSGIAPEPLPPFPGNVDPPLLVSPEWLNQQLNDRAENLIVMDLGDWSEYRGGHIPGAIHSYWQETIERNETVYGTLLNQKDYDSETPTEVKRIDWLKRYGISNDSIVIACDHGDGRRAARIVYFLRFLGLPAGAVLDGGVAAWKGSGYALEKSETSPRTLDSDPVVKTLGGYLLGTRDLQNALTDPATILVDIRSEDERHNTVDDQFDTGVIAGSIWMPWTDYVADGHGRFIAPADALSKLSALGITTDRRIALYGTFGSDPDQMWLLLKLLAYPSVEIYDRGWVEWSTIGGLPVEPLP